MHVHFVNENIGGHATMHRHLRAALAARQDMTGTFFDVPRERFMLRLASASVPGLARLDLDLHLLRARLAQSALVRRHLAQLVHTPDVLHAYTQNTALLSVDYMRRVPTVVSIDATDRQNAYRVPHRKPTPFTPVTIPLTTFWERRVYERARRVVAHSRWAADSVLSYGIPASRLEVIPFGIAVPPLPARTARGAEQTRIVFVGTSMERKGGWRLLQLWRRSLRETTTLTLVTPEHVPEENGLEVRNDVLPGDGRLEEILAAADIFALPGEIDAFGYAVLEAMAAGLPVVVPRVAAMPELVEDGVTGLVVPPGDDDAFASALASLAADPDRRAAFGAAGRERVQARFDAEVTTKALVDVLQDVAA